MKKFATILLAIALIATLSVASFAATVEAVPGSEGKDLNVSYTAMTAAGTVYSIDIAWDEDLSFDYSAGTQGAWNPETHQYAPTENVKWTDNEVNVTVTNHSNAAVNATLTVVDVENDGVTVSGNLTGAQTLATAVDTEVANAPKVEFKITASGTPTASGKVATATVAIAAAQ